jgi:hypothetical protein
LVWFDFYRRRLLCVKQVKKLVSLTATFWFSLKWLNIGELEFLRVIIRVSFISILLYGTTSRNYLT